MMRLESVSTAVVQSEPAADEPAEERLLVNGVIHQRGGPPAEWLLIRGDAIAEVGSGPPPEAAAAQVIDLGGKFVLPGLHDSHLHTYSVGEASFYVDLGGCASIAELKQRLGDHARAHPEFSWVIGLQWAQHEMGGVYPCAADLDDALGEGDTRPVFLWRACWHIGCANTAGLAIAGLAAGQAIPETPGGLVDVDEEGNPTGVLRERATDLITPFTEEKDPAVRRKFFLAGVAACLANGLTALQSNDGGGVERGNRGGAWEHYLAMEADGTLPLRVYLTVDHSDLAAGTAPPSGSRSPGGLAACERVKLFGDGSLGAETAAIRGAYNAEDGSERGGAEEEGLLIQPDDELAAKIVDAKSQGFRLEIHAIGDRAAASVLDGLERAGVTPAERPVMTHCQLLGADLIERMERMQCIANIQPQFVVTDAPFARARLPARIQQHAYVWKTLLDAGIPCAGGSDAPVEVPAPLMGMHDAIFRRSAGAEPSDAYKPEQALSFEQALDICECSATVCRHAVVSDAGRCRQQIRSERRTRRVKRHG